MSMKAFLLVKIVPIIFCLISYISAQLKEWRIPCGAIYNPENCQNASVKTLLTVEDYERCAPALLDTINREYVWGAVGSQATLFENKEAFNRIWIKKKVLQGKFKYNLETTVFGRRIGLPLGISPTAGHSFYHPEGGKGLARGAIGSGAIMILSCLSLTSLEDIAKTVPRNAEIWMQTHIFPRRDLTVQLVQRAEKAGFKAIVVTVDEMLSIDIRCKARHNFFEKYKYKSPQQPQSRIPTI